MASVKTKKEISKSEYAQVVGLLTLAAAQRVALNGTADALAELLGVEDESTSGDAYYGAVSDAIWSDFSVRRLLKTYEIKVRK